MLVLPAIDIKNGKCVRLFQGQADQETVYGKDPVAMALKWEGKGRSFFIWSIWTERLPEHRKIGVWFRRLSVWSRLLSNWEEGFVQRRRLRCSWRGSLPGDNWEQGGCVA